jgi:hypothetical protein
MTKGAAGEKKMLSRFDAATTGHALLILWRDYTAGYQV